MKDDLFGFLLMVLVAFLVMLHQYLFWGEWWTWSQFLHHESFAFGLVCIGFGFMLGWRFRKE